MHEFIQWRVHQRTYRAMVCTLLRLILKRSSVQPVLHNRAMKIQWWIQDFPEEGAPTPRGGGNLQFCQISEKLHEIKRIWIPGVRPSRPPLDPPLILMSWRWPWSQQFLVNIHSNVQHQPQSELQLRNKFFKHIQLFVRIYILHTSRN